MQRPPFLPALVPIGLVALAVGVGGCRDAPVPVRVKDRTLTLVQTEYAFRPQVARAAPGRLTIVVRNEGRLGHNLALVRDRREIARVSTQKPGLTQRLEIKNLPAGDYKIVCTISNHEELGMYGTLAVR